MIAKEDHRVSLPRKAQQAVRRLARRWVKGKDLWITAGVGKGLRFNSAHSNPAYTIGTNEMPVQRAMADSLCAGDVFYDVGANVGFFSVIAARLVGASGEVISFEPVPQNAAAIRRNQKLNNFQNITVVQEAVSNTCGQADLQVTRTSGGATLASAGKALDIDHIISVPLTSIDACVKEKGFPPPNVIKIDVEGAEVSVLQGMSYTLHCCRPIIIYEMDDQDQAGYSKKNEACKSILQGYGYDITRLEESYPESGWLVGHYLALP